MKITEEQRKLLTEWLGEEWHEWKDKSKGCQDAIMDCFCTGEENTCPRNCTFNNWNDFGAVVEKLRTTPKEEINDLVNQCFIVEFMESGAIQNSLYEMWLLNTERFCILVAEAIKKGVIK